MKKCTGMLIVFGVLLLFSVSACSKTQPGAKEGSENMTESDESSQAMAAMAEGAEIYDNNCKLCHGANAEGDIGPDLTDDVWRYGGSDKDVFASIAKGRPNGMPSWENKLSEEDIRNVMAYIKSLSAK